MEDFGGKLRQARERRGISLRQIAASTKISVAALEAPERNDSSKLPGGIFSRAFVRSYAIEVGLDPEQTVREFLERFNEEPPPSAQVHTASISDEDVAFEQRQRRASLVATVSVIVVAVVAVAAFAEYRWGNHSGAAQTPPVSAGSEQAAPPTADPGPSAPAAPDVANPTDTAGSAPVAADALKVDLHPTGDCWISATVDGKRLFARVVKSGEHETLTVRREGVLEIGDAGAFAFSVNGREGKPVGDSGEVKTIKLTPADAAQYVR
jgi:cytoskeleton protein RodZ